MHIYWVHLMHQNLSAHALFWKFTCKSKYAIINLYMYITCNKVCPLIGWIMFLYFNFLKHLVTKNPIGVHLDRQKCKNYLLLHSLFTFSIECSVFLILSSDICFKNEDYNKDQMQNSTQRKSRRRSVLE